MLRLAGRGAKVRAEAVGKESVPCGAEGLDPVEFVCCLSAVDHINKTAIGVAVLKEPADFIAMGTDDEIMNIIREKESTL